MISLNVPVFDFLVSQLMSMTYWGLNASFMLVCPLLFWTHEPNEVMFLWILWGISAWNISASPILMSENIGTDFSSQTCRAPKWFSCGLLTPICCFHSEGGHPQGPVAAGILSAASAASSVGGLSGRWASLSVTLNFEYLSLDPPQA